MNLQQSPHFFGQFLSFIRDLIRNLQVLIRSNGLFLDKAILHQIGQPEAS
jgi:hypothetical protein